MDQLSLLHADEFTCNLKQNKTHVNGTLFILRDIQPKRLSQGETFIYPSRSGKMRKSP